MAVVPRGDSPSLQEVSGDSALGGLGCQADVGSVTLSDLYAGMLHSMSRLLSARPACVISTKTLILQNWGSRRRCRCRHRAARTGCQGGRCARKRPRERPSPPSAPGTGRGALRDCGNLPPQAHPGRAALQLCRPSPLRAHSSWTFLDSSAGRRLGRENRLTRLEWLISPVKTASRPRALPGKGGGHCREIKVKFEKLHREFCRSPGNQPCRALPPASSAVGTPGGDPESPGSLHRLGTCRPGTALGKTRAERSREAPKRLSGRPTGVPAPSPAGPATARSPSCSRLSSALCQGRALRLPGAWASPSRALSLPGPRPSYGRARCKEIKDEFNKLHEEYQAKLPERTKALPRPGAPPHRARVDLQYQQGGASGKSHPSASFPEPRKWALARHSLGGPPCPAPLEVLPSAWLTADAQSGALCPTKRRRLSDPQVCGRRAEAPGSWPAASRAAARPEEEGSSVEPGREETKVRVHVFPFQTPQIPLLPLKSEIPPTPTRVSTSRGS
ncbi:Holliday junction recognition protein [Galemys pyrenaicus]|uniref:Holliday junction recognition protein n=1 Tax=Galemys pyrenaicus TaxID=202257 RepID=A0A8J6A823_GALPY|nr:Holliday junction recognition protein [Galemys pyrenaicus]